MVDFMSWEKHCKRMSSNAPNLETVPQVWNQMTGDGCECVSCVSRLNGELCALPVVDYYDIGFEKDNSRPDHFYFLCDSILRGYALNERQWGEFSRCCAEW